MLVHKSFAVAVVLTGAIWVAPGSAPSDVEAVALESATESEIAETRAGLSLGTVKATAFTRETNREVAVEEAWELAPAAEAEKIEEKEEAYEDTDDPDILAWLINRISFYPNEYP